MPHSSKIRAELLGRDSEKEGWRGIRSIPACGTGVGAHDYVSGPTDRPEHVSPGCRSRPKLSTTWSQVRVPPGVPVCAQTLTD
jgi:hypothetical protein